MRYASPSALTSLFFPLCTCLVTKQIEYQKENKFGWAINWGTIWPAAADRLAIVQLLWRHRRLFFADLHQTDAMVPIFTIWSIWYGWQFWLSSSLVKDLSTFDNINTIQQQKLVGFVGLHHLAHLVQIFSVQIQQRFTRILSTFGAHCAGFSMIGVLESGFGGEWIWWIRSGARIIRHHAERRGQRFPTGHLTYL